MGSKFSVYNNTNEPVYMVYKPYVFPLDPLLIVACFLTIGSNLLLLAKAGITEAMIVATGATITAAVVKKLPMGAIPITDAAALAAEVNADTDTTFFSFLSFQSISGIVDVPDAALEEISDQNLKASLQQHKKVGKDIIDGMIKIFPNGGYFYFSGTLSLIMKTTVVYDQGKKFSRNCFTGSTANSNRKYYLKNDFDGDDLAPNFPTPDDYTPPVPPPSVGLNTYCFHFPSIHAELVNKGLLKKAAGGTNNPAETKALMVKNMFDACDRDGDGYVNTTDLHAIMTEFGMEPTKELVQDVMRQATGNPDGKADIKEFESMFSFAEATTEDVDE